MTLGLLALATALSAVNPLYTPTKLYKGLKRPQIKAAASLVSSFTVEESVLKGEAAGLCELIDKCQGHLIAHVQSGDHWDCARVRNRVAYPLEFKVVHDLDPHKEHEALCDYLNIETDCGWVDVKKKDWILMLGGEILLQSKDCELRDLFGEETARLRDGAVPGTVDKCRVLNVDNDHLEFHRADGLQMVILDQESKAVGFISSEYLATLSGGGNSDEGFHDAFCNALRRQRFDKTAGIRLLVTVEGHHLFYAESYGLDADDNQLTTRPNQHKVSEWELTMKVCHDGSKVEDICFEYDGKTVHFDDVDAFLNSPEAERFDLDWYGVGKCWTAISVNIGPGSACHIGMLYDDANRFDVDAFVARLDWHIDVFPRRDHDDLFDGEDDDGSDEESALIGNRSLCFDAAALTGSDAAEYIEALGGFNYSQLKRKLENDLWTPKERRLIDRFAVAAGITEASPGWDMRVKNALVVEMVVTACFAKAHPLDRCNLATCGASANFGCDEGMFDYWMREFSNVKSYTSAKRFTYMGKLIGDVVYTITDLKFASKPTSAKLEGQVFVVEAMGAETSRVRLVEIESTTGQAPFYDQTLVRGSENALKVAKDAPTRLLLQSFVTFDFARAGFLLRPRPANGIAARNARLHSVFDDETPFALDVAFVGGSDALTKWNKYHAPCGGKISGASSALQFDGDANGVHAYLETSGPFQPVFFAGTRSLFMSSAAAALGESEPFERLNESRGGRDRIKLESRTSSTLMIDQKGSRSQPGLFTSLEESVRHEYDNPGVLPIYATGSDEVTMLLPRLVEDIGIVSVASGADSARTRAYPAEPPSKKPSLAVSVIVPTRTEPPPTRSGQKPTATKAPRSGVVPKKRALPDSAPAKASAELVPQLQTLTDAMVAASDNGGVLYPLLASELEVDYVPVGLLDDSDAEPLDLSKYEKLIYDELNLSEKRKWPNGKPEFVWATSVVGVQPVTYEFAPTKKRRHVVAIQGTNLKAILLKLEPVGVKDHNLKKRTIEPTLTDLTLDKLKKRIAFAKKRDDGLYEQDGSSRGAEVVWKAIEAYIEFRKNEPYRRGK